jgi:hypothetical protein
MCLHLSIQLVVAAGAHQSTRDEQQDGKEKAHARRTADH